MNERSSYLTSMFCFVAGGLTGVGLSLLMAPQSGKATRQIMAKTLNGSVDSVLQLRDHVVARGEEAWDEAAHRLDGAAAALTGNGAPKAGKRNDAPSV